MESSSVNGICRCCATQGAFKDIKTSYHWMGEEEVYSDMLRECFDVNLTSTDQGGICELCVTQLRNACNFKKQVMQTEDQFKQHLRSKGFKQAVKEEMSGFDDNDSDDNDMDNVDDEDYVPDFEVPIKIESESEEKTKKRSAKTPTTRAKKSKSSDGEGAVKSSRRSSSDESDTPLIFVEENRITLDRKVNFTSFISILPAEARKKTPSTPAVEKPKKVEKHKENIIDDIIFDDDMDHEPLEPLPLPIPKEESKPKREKRKTTLKPKTKRKAPRPRDTSEEKVRKRPVTEIEWHLENIKNILTCSNATPIRSKENREYQCSYCKLQFPKLTDLKLHTLTSKSHKKKKPDFLKIHYASLSKHIVYLDITSLQCTVCQLEMVSLEVLMEHLKTDHDENMHLVIKNQIMPLRVVDEKLACSVCGTELEFEGIQEHMAQHYRNYVCEFCDTSFVIRSKMIEHKKAVHDL